MSYQSTKGAPEPILEISSGQTGTGNKFPAGTGTDLIHVIKERARKC
jgi:hypothetical protein